VLSFVEILVAQVIIHSEGIPQFDLLHTAKALRCYAGILSTIASATTQSKTARRSMNY
jgi:hypothetical protein